MELIHLLLVPFYVIIPLILVIYYRVYYLQDPVDKFFFLSGFLLKIFGAIVAILIYIFYYGGGDTTFYFLDACKISDYLIKHPEYIYTILSANNTTEIPYLDFIPVAKSMFYGNDTPTYTVIKIGSIFSLITFKSIYLTSIFCSYLAFIASWIFYKFVKSFLTIHKRALGFSVFYVPSVVFWGSALFKDTFTLIGLYLFIVGIINVFAYNKWKFKNIIYILIGFYLIVHIRSFFIASVTPALLYWITQANYLKIPNFTIRVLIIPIVAFIMIILFGLAYNMILQNFEDLSIEKIENRSKGFQNWHTQQGGSSYNLGEIEFTPTGIIKKIPIAIITTYFRPFLWEATKPIIFLSFLQSFGFLLVTIYIIYKMKIYYFFRYMFKSYRGLSFLVFSFIYAFVAGFTSYNFGALDRYKIPCLSTYLIALLFIYETYQLSKSK